MKFKKNFKKGFTLVELIVVIAIVAILAAVSVVSYVAFINSANESADIQLVKQLNTCLQADEALNGKHDFVKENRYNELESLLQSNGFIIENLTRTKSGCDMVYQGSDENNKIINRYALLKGNDVLYSETSYSSSLNYQNVWIPETAKEAQDLSGDGKGVILNVELGHISEFEAHGNVIVNGAKVDSIKFVNDDETKKVTISTNGGDLYIGDDQTKAFGKITHFGTLDKAVVYTTNSSFHTHGKIASMDLHQGKAVAEDKGYVALVKADAGTEIAEVDSGVFYIPSGVNANDIADDIEQDLGYKADGDGNLVIDPATEAGQAREEKIDSTVYEISNRNELIAFRDAWNNGILNPGTEFSLTKDIDMTGYDWISPIGTKTRPFEGSFEGNKFEIKNLSNNGASTEEEMTNATSGTTGKIFGLFGYVQGEVNISNLDLSVYAAWTEGKCWAGLVAVSGYNTPKDRCDLTIKKVTVDGSLLGNDKVAGFLGQSAYDTATGNTTFIDCTNKANIVAGNRAAGILGAGGGKSAANKLTFTNCKNTGDISATNGWAAGICSSLNQSGGVYEGIDTPFVNSTTYEATNVVNEGSISGNVAKDLFYDGGSANIDNTGTGSLTKVLVTFGSRAHNLQENKVLVNAREMTGTEYVIGSLVIQPALYLDSENVVSQIKTDGYKCYTKFTKNDISYYLAYNSVKEAILVLAYGSTGAERAQYYKDGAFEVVLVNNSNETYDYFFTQNPNGKKMFTHYTNVHINVVRSGYTISGLPENNYVTTSD